MKDFFISYNKHDKQWAEWIAWTLEENGFTVIVAAWDFQGGGNAMLYMDRAIKEARQTIAVLSQHDLKANYTQPEWAAVFSEDPQGLERTLVLVRVREFEPQKGLLKQIVYVDLVGLSEAEARQRLLDGLKPRAKPDQPPSFPGPVPPTAERTEPERVPFPGGDDPTPEAQSTLATFEFDVVTVSLEKQKGFLGLLPAQVKFASRKGQAQSLTEDLGSGVGLEMVSLPGGQFFMGAPATEAKSSDDERPQHLVRVKPFFMGKYLVTQEQWLMVLELPKVNHGLNPNCSYFKGLKRLVESVNWWQAVELCDRLSRKTGKTYRLPSEAEWEYACRAGTTTPFHFGETLTTDLANYDGNYTYGAGAKGAYRKQTTDVGSFPPNAFGLYDLHGNVWEWCLDYWHANYEGAPTDGSAWLEGGGSEDRVRRGGSWDIIPWYCRSAIRNLNQPDERDFNYGFRVVCRAART